MQGKYDMYKEMFSDIEKVNRFARNIYLVCCFLYGIIGYFLYRSSDHVEMWQPVLYYVLLIFPLVLMLVDYSESRLSEEMRYTMFIPSAFFYLYLLLTENSFLYLIYALCLLGISTLYNDNRFARTVGFVLVGIHLAVAIYFGVIGEAEHGNRLMHTFLIGAVAFFFNLSSAVSAYIRDAKVAELTRLGQRFEALVLVGKKRVFEYYVEKDEMLLFRATEKGPDYRKNYENFSESAKKLRHVLYADWKIFDEFIAKCRSGEPEFEVCMRLRDRKADYLWYKLSAKTLYDEAGRPHTVIGTMENVDEWKRMELRLADENMRDPLTKLYKRFHAKALTEEFLEAQDGSEYAGLLIIDVDNFEGLSEKMGETFADEVLRSIAADLDDVFYTSDILGRAGGDEFIVFMKNIEKPSDIEMKIQEIQSVVRKTYTEKEMNFASTVTIGASVYPDDGNTYKELYSNAEKALAYAKKNGKDTYCFYDVSKEAEYDSYHIEEKHDKIKKKNEMAQMQNKAAGESLFELASRLLEESTDTDSAINLLLRQVARQMGVDGILIRRRIGREKRIAYPYHCLLLDLPFDTAHTEAELSQEEWENEIAYIKENNGLACCNRVEDLENEVIKKAALQNGLKSYARSSFFDKGEYIGSVDVVNFTRERNWSAEDRQMIQTLTNVVSSYLFKMKAFEDATETVERLTGYDSVTGMCKYEKFLELANEYLETAPHGNYAVIYLDFSNFKYINEIYGYEVGDSILRAYADEARSYGERFIYGCRVFSDNMVCLIHADGWTTHEMAARLENASKRFREKIKKQYLESNLSCIFGVCSFVVDGSKISLKNIISNANLARKEAKKPENPPCIIYDAKMGDKLLQEMTFTNDMEAAFKNNEFAVYMQPKVDLKNCKIAGAEALIRWIKPDGTMIFPNEFVPVFEKNKTITQLDYFVYDQVCQYLSERIKNGERTVNISMNVSRVHLFSIDQLINYIRGLIEKYEIPPQLLEFELTETVFTDTVDDTILLMSKLRDLGVRVSMDDFGSGYSSLNVLTKLPLDVLKLDKEFLRDFEKDSDEKIIIPGIIDMAKKMNLHVVCEGVETKEQVEFLRDVDCDIAQGYYYSKPMPLEIFSEMLEDDNFVINQENLKN